MKVLIAGGGIGGLTAALSLHAAGMTDAQVVEAAPSTIKHERLHLSTRP
jgi:5-methylphenazine-1-carboxylate 1-monooxygenase